MGLIGFDHHSAFEKKRIELLASLIDDNFEQAASLLREIASLSADIPPMEMDEPDQKTLRQIFQILKIWEKRSSQGQELRKFRQEIGKTVSKAAREQIKNVRLVPFDDFFEKAGLTESLYRLIIENTISLQITTGCSNCCRRCNEWALPGVRKHFSFHAVKKMLSDLFASGNDSFSCYSSSDPLDWKDGDATIYDIAGFLKKNGHRPAYGLLTKIPRGSEDVLIKLSERDVDFSVSVTGKNKQRVMEIQERTGKKFDLQHDTEDLLIAAGLDEDFETVKSSITDVYGVEITPDGVFAIIPTFTSAIHPTGQCRIRIDKKTPFVPRKVTGRAALSRDYFSLLQVMTGDGCRHGLQSLIKPQVENILLCNGEDDVTPPGMMNMKEYFKSLENDAVMKRKELFPAVLKKMRKDYIHKMRGARSSKPVSGIKAEFKKSLTEYKSRCNPASMKGIRLSVFSKLLGTINEYARQYPAETSVILFLRKKDLDRYERMGRELAGNGNAPEDLVLSHETGLYPVFQYMMFRTLKNPEDPWIKGLIHS